MKLQRVEVGIVKSFIFLKVYLLLMNGILCLVAKVE
jgi:hypothetical protein